MLFLSLSFFVTAILYAAVGFGGGSTYNALLVLAKTDYQILPSIALLCNLIVVSGGTYRFFCAGHINFKRIMPWIITSVPAALLGGYLHISETIFIGLLGFSLLVAGLRMLWPQNKNKKQDFSSSLINRYSFLPPLIGLALGLLAGLVGIGGGIFLAPLLYLLRWDHAKSIAGTCSFFILVNSLSGLIGQILKPGNADFFGDIGAYWMLFPAVFIGGQIGSHMGTTRLNSQIITRMTAFLILYVSIRLLFNWLEIMQIIQ